MSKSQVKNARTSQRGSSNTAVKKNGNMAAALLLSVVIGTVTLLACVMAFSFVLAKSDNPDRLIGASAIISVILSGAMCGFTSSKISHKPVSALISGIAMILVSLVISLFFEPDETQNSIIFKTILTLCFVFSSFAAGIFASKSKKRNRKK